MLLSQQVPTGRPGWTQFFSQHAVFYVQDENSNLHQELGTAQQRDVAVQKQLEELKLQLAASQRAERVNASEVHDLQQQLGEAKRVKAVATCGVMVLLVRFLAT